MSSVGPRAGPWTRSAVDLDPIRGGTPGGDLDIGRPLFYNYQRKVSRETIIALASIASSFKNPDDPLKLVNQEKV